MSAAAPARSGLINPAGLPGPEIQEEPLLAGYVTFCIDFCHIFFIIESIGHPSFSPEKAGCSLKNDSRSVSFFPCGRMEILLCPLIP
jgi:hypothetical protein